MQERRKTKPRATQKKGVEKKEAPTLCDVEGVSQALKDHAVRLVNQGDEHDAVMKFMGVVQPFNRQKFTLSRDDIDESRITASFTPKKNMDVAGLKASLRPIYLWLKKKNRTSYGSSNKKDGGREKELIAELIQDLVGNHHETFPAHEVYQYFINLALDRYKVELQAAAKKIAAEDVNGDSVDNYVESEKTKQFIVSVKRIFNSSQSKNPKQIVEEWHPQILRVFDAEFKEKPSQEAKPLQVQTVKKPAQEAKPLTWSQKLAKAGGAFVNKVVEVGGAAVDKIADKVADVFSEKTPEGNLKENIEAIYDNFCTAIKQYPGKISPEPSPTVTEPKTALQTLPAQTSSDRGMLKPVQGVQDVETKVEKITAKLDEVTQKIAEQTEACEKLQQEIQQKSDQKWKDDLSRKIADSEQRITAYTANLQAAEKSLQENQQAIDANERQITQADSKVVANRQGIHRTNQEIGSTTAEKTKLAAECEKMRAAIKAHPSQADKANSDREIAAAESDVNARRKTIEQLQGESLRNQAALEMVKGRVEAAAKELAECEEALAAITSLKTQIAQLQEWVDDGAEKVSRLQQELPQLMSRHAEIGQQLERVRAEIEAAQKELAEIQNKKERLSEAEIGMTRRITAREAEVIVQAAIIEEIEDEKIKLAPVLAGLEEKHQEKIREKEQLEARIVVTKGFLKTEYRPELERKEQEAKTSREELAQKESAIITKEAELKAQQAIVSGIADDESSAKAVPLAHVVIEKNRWDAVFSIPVIGFFIRLIAGCFGVKDYETRVRKANKSIQKQKDGNIRVITTQKQEADKAVIKMTEELGLLQSEKGEIEQRINTIEQESAAAQEKVTESEAQLAEQCAELEQVSAAQAEIVREQQEKQEENSRLESEGTEAEGALAESIKTLADLQTEKKQLPSDGELTAREQILLPCLAGYQQVEQTASAQLEQLNQEIACAQAELASVEQALQANRDTLQQKSEGLDSIKGPLVELNAKIEKQEAVKVQIMGELYELQNKRKTLAAYGQETEGNIQVQQTELEKEEVVLAEAKSKLDKEKEKKSQLLVKKTAACQGFDGKLELLNQEKHKFSSEIGNISALLKETLNPEKERLLDAKRDLERAKKPIESALAEEKKVLADLQSEFNSVDILQWKFLGQKIGLFGKFSGLYALRAQQNKLNAQLPGANEKLADAQKKKTESEFIQQAVEKASSSKGTAVRRSVW